MLFLLYQRRLCFVTPFVYNNGIARRKRMWALSAVLIDYFSKEKRKCIQRYGRQRVNSDVVNSDELKMLAPDKKKKRYMKTA